ncbi:MAG TPA: cupin domain-containing protein [Steroidobacteraceae bacterium]|nr:cupin domain-containing protein [Steroidobacteraceae bacterium]
MNDQSAGFWHVGDIESERTRLGNAYLEFLRIPALSAGVYVLAAGGEDTQSPHREDELYFVVRGKARMRAGSEDRAVEAGSVIFVAADAEHRFYAIEEELSVLVFFAPAETLT